MKKSELKDTITEITGTAKVLSNEFGGIDDVRFLRVVWKLSVDELKDLLSTSENDLKKVKSFSKGTLGVMNRRDALHIKQRINLLKQIISQKKKNPNIIPDFMKESKTRPTIKKSELKEIIIDELKMLIREKNDWGALTPEENNAMDKTFTKFKEELTLFFKKWEEKFGQVRSNNSLTDTNSRNKFSKKMKELMADLNVVERMTDAHTD